MLTSSGMINEVGVRVFMIFECWSVGSHKTKHADLKLVNLGKWILRYLFDRLVEEEARRDATFRQKLLASTSRSNSLRRENAPTSIELPSSRVRDSQDLMNEDDAVMTPRPAANGAIRPVGTPGLIIGAATPYLNGNNADISSDRPNTAEERNSLEKRASQHSQPRSSTERKSDYFSSSAQAKSPVDTQIKGAVTPGDTSFESTTLTSAQSTVEGDKEEKTKEGGIFSKGFRMKFPKKIGRVSTDVKPAAVDEKSEGSDKSEDKEDRTIQDNFFGTLQKIRYDYEERVQNDPFSLLSSSITPSPLSETPRLHLPPYTTVIIQDEQPDSGGVADLYTGTISSVGYDADSIEKMAPMWLSELVLRVRRLLPYTSQSSCLPWAESNATQRYP